MKSTLEVLGSAMISCVMLQCWAWAATNSISIDSVVGEVAAGKLATGERIEIYVRLVHIPDSPPWDVIQSTNAFALYSPDSAAWSPGVFVDTLVEGFPPPPQTSYDTTYYGKWINPQNLGHWRWVRGEETIYDEIGVEMFSDHDNNPGTPDLFGEGADTIQYNGAGDPGIFYYDEIAWLLLLDSISSLSVGKTLCLNAADDSAPDQHWRWITDWEGHIDTLAPTWDGPRCFEIVADCCEHLRGNINLDLQDTIDISDLTSLVAWMFRSGITPPCMLQADIDANGTHDITDLTYLVAYMFKSGPAPASCP